MFCAHPEYILKIIGDNDTDIKQDNIYPPLENLYLEEDFNNRKPITICSLSKYLYMKYQSPIQERKFSKSKENGQWDKYSEEEQQIITDILNQIG